MSWDPLRPAELRQALSRHGIRPRKRLGQHFLIDRNVARRTLELARVRRDDCVLEVGAGAGALTLLLGRRAQRVVAVEVDARLRPLLRELGGGCARVRWVFADALEADWEALRAGGGEWKFVANVPYYITAPLLARALGSRPAFTRITIMVQREVAGRLAAGPGQAGYGAASVLVAYYARVEDTFPVSPRSFWPRPQVGSTVVAIVPEPRRRDRPPPETFFPVVRAAFGRRRKMLRNALCDDPHLALTRERAERVLAAAGVDGRRRAETLAVGEFGTLARAWRELLEGER